MIVCYRCNQESEAHPSGNGKVCVACHKAEMNMVAKRRNDNEYWMDIAAEAGLEIWERQPGETDRDNMIWTLYRDMYPMVKPSYTTVAQQLDLSVSAIKNVAMRWDFAVRMQAWIKKCDETTLMKRQEEIVGMNQRHLAMAKELNEKLGRAIKNIDPDNLRPGELSSLMKMATDLERKARIDHAAQERDALNTKAGGALGGTTDGAGGTKKEDLKEIVDILMKAGVLGGPGAKVGVKQTTTTEVISIDGSESD